MAAEQNPYARIGVGLKTTAAAAAFVEGITFDAIPSEAVHIATRCLLDGLGLFVAGSREHTVQLLVDDAAQTGGRPDALLLGRGNTKVPALLAARVLGTAGHAHDWDDSQVSTDPAHVYGLLTHPTIPPLSSALVMAQKLGRLDGKTFMLAFLTGFEVECKISEWMLPQHYVKGMHSSGTVGTFGAYAAAAKLLGLRGNKLCSGFGIAASFIRRASPQAFPRTRGTPDPLSERAFIMSNARPMLATSKRVCECSGGQVISMAAISRATSVHL